ncbi:uncharacterized protein BO66DRAFT_257815 [Aspergillus aculeatinus CBS 121060]|uniref:Uncharacterized protein n=1 Tax=Aspergillus aculeatinus CBS 121060 TaxID=1448322 RepID=A0ACD1GRG6_9EURO|nr:hypothetical protein BO66DRAFT_257815 [Aspergillus aculeatinus CBS 121060]RAH63907.1 hypothetical protein BO66DRAFT_257815 [Aspergillus aculeatinus CBS 121060]
MLCSHRKFKMTISRTRPTPPCHPFFVMRHAADAALRHPWARHIPGSPPRDDEHLHAAKMTACCGLYCTFKDSQFRTLVAFDISACGQRIVLTIVFAHAQRTGRQHPIDTWSSMFPLLWLILIDRAKESNMHVEADHLGRPQGVSTTQASS